MKPHLTIAAVAIALASCKPPHQPQQPANNAQSPVLPAPSAPPAVSNMPAPQPVPTAREPIVDPKSTEAAVGALQGFVALLNQGKFDEAYMLLGPGAPPRAEFDKHFARYSALRVTMGKPGDQEAAAGSIYLSVPLTLSGDVEGKHSSSSATAILRRVNDVPGSTEAQRHWHIERIDWGSAG